MSGAIILRTQRHHHATNPQHAASDEHSRTDSPDLPGSLGRAVLTAHSAALPSRVMKSHSDGTNFPGSFIVSSPRKTDPLTGLRQLLIFQLKLGADALRDLLMSPVSILMFLLDLILRPPQEQSYHEQLMTFGRKTDRWINLFEDYSEEQTGNGVEKRTTLDSK